MCPLLQQQRVSKACLIRHLQRQCREATEWHNMERGRGRRLWSAGGSIQTDEEEEEEEYMFAENGR